MLLFCTLLVVGWWGSRGFHPELRGFPWGLAALAPVLALLVGWAAGGEYSGWRDQRAYTLVVHSMMYIVWAYLGVGPAPSEGGRAACPSGTRPSSGR